MLQQLTIVITCTDRKTRVPSPQLTARTLPQGTVEQRCGEWVSRVSTSPVEDVPLRQLYKGGTWQQFLQLVADAADNWATRPLVASAGLGLQELDSSLPSYAATFSPGHADSACAASVSGEWWAGLRNVPGARPMNELTGPVLAVLSSAYSRAMHEDLAALAARSDVDLLLVGGWQDVAGATRIPADRALRGALGGTVGSLLPRMARHWLAIGAGRSLTSTETAGEWSRWATGVRSEETVARRAMTHADVMDFVHSLRRSQPKVSATSALRTLRDAGFACEQKRFGRLFRMTQEAA